MNISINPTYYCNFRCHFCYLTKNQLSDIKILDLSVLEEKLNELIVYEKIDHVDLYGGEIGLLPKNYVKKLKDLLKFFGVRTININTNLSMLNETLNDEDFYLSISYDFDVREQNERVWSNMLKLKRPFSILLLASDELIKKDVNEMIRYLNLLKNLKTVEIKPYSSNQANQLNVKFSDFENFVKKWITSKTEKKFEFINECLIRDVISKQKNSFSDDHIYITPEGKFAVLEFDLNDREYFLHCETYEEYLNWCKKEKNRVLKNKFCSKCEYFGNCLSEHLREVKDLKNSCNGFKNMIDWYKSERMEN